MNTYNYGECGAEGFLRHLSAEHDAINLELASINLMFENYGNQASKVAWKNQLMTLTQRLQKQLVHHFHEEEFSGCMEEAAARRPTLSHQVTLIEEEHQEILTDLNHLIQSMEKINFELQNMVQLKNKFDQLVEKVKLHESNENLIVRRGFNALEE